MRIWLKKDEMKRIKMKKKEIVKEIRRKNVKEEVGRIGEKKMKEKKKIKIKLKKKGSIKGEKKLEKIIIREKKEGQ